MFILEVQSTSVPNDDKEGSGTESEADSRLVNYLAILTITT